MEKNWYYVNKKFFLCQIDMHMPLKTLTYLLIMMWVLLYIYISLYKIFASVIKHEKIIEPAVLDWNNATTVLSNLKECRLG